MMAGPAIAIVVSPRDWDERLHRFVADHGGARVRARILDAREALDEGYSVLVAEDLTSFLTPRLVDRLHSSGRRILGVYEPTEPQGREHLRQLGVDEIAETTAAPEELLQIIETLAAGLQLEAELESLARRPAATRDGTVPDGRTEAGSPGRARRGAAGLPGSQSAGRVIAVAGPAGGPGATEVALGLAAAVRVRGHDTLLVDADDVAPAVAQRLDLPLHPNLRTAIDMVQHRSGDLADAVVRLPTGPAVLPGVPTPGDAAVRPGEAVDTVGELARRHEVVVVNVGHRLEDLATHTSGHGRYGLARALLASADVLLGVAAPTPVGLGRLVDWIADVRTVSRAPLNVAFNRVPSSGFKRAELAEELRRTFSPPVLAFLPEDRRVGEAAWTGEIPTSGPWVKAVASLADDLLPAVARPSRSTRRGLGPMTRLLPRRGRTTTLGRQRLTGPGGSVSSTGRAGR